jgi:hypothetical protein
VPFLIPAPIFSRVHNLTSWAIGKEVAWRPLSNPPRCSVRGLFGSVPSGRVSWDGWFNPVRPKRWLCVMSGDFALWLGRTHTMTLLLLMLLLFWDSIRNVLLPLQPVLYLRPHCPGPRVGRGRVSLASYSYVIHKDMPIPLREPLHGKCSVTRAQKSG